MKCFIVVVITIVLLLPVAYALMSQIKTRPEEMFEKVLLILTELSAKIFKKP